MNFLGCAIMKILSENNIFIFYEKRPYERAHHKYFSVVHFNRSSVNNFEMGFLFFLVSLLKYEGMKLPNIDIPAGLEDAYNLIIRVLGGINPSTVLPKRLSPARRRYSEFAEVSYFVQWQDIYNSLGSFCKDKWTALWESLPFGSHGGAHGYPGSGYSAFVYYNAQRVKSGLPLLYCPWNDNISSWTFVNPINLTTFYNVFWSDALGYFVSFGLFFGAGSGVRVVTSSNAISWTLRLSIGTGINAIPAFSPELGRFIFVLGGGNPLVWYSSDGITWNTHACPSAVFFNTACWSPYLGLFVITGQDSSTGFSMTSSDGINWTKHTFSSVTALSGVIWCTKLKLFIALAFGVTGKKIAVSVDGITWHLRSTPVGFNATYLLDCPVGSEAFMAVALHNVTPYYTSVDAINFTPRTSAVFDRLSQTIYIPSLNIYFGIGRLSLATRTFFSYDCKTWYYLAVNGDFETRQWAYSPSLARIVGGRQNGFGYATLS